jgi:hypothetical protein
VSDEWKMKIWDALKRTDPAHTKKFQRGGGFKGTAVKPIYCDQKMTEYFGPCGNGWGMTKPEFQVVPVGVEIAVYCTVGLWHGTPNDLVYGVGGDFVAKTNKHGLFADDEAFKKAYTDALGNAMKHLGMSADIHMGQHDDDKYVTELRREFAGQEAPTPADNYDRPKNGEMHGPLGITALKTAMRAFAHDLEGCADIDSLNGLVMDNKAVLDQCQRDLPDWYFGRPNSEVKGAQSRISERTVELSAPEHSYLAAG